MNATEHNIQNDERFREAILLLEEARGIAFAANGRVKEISVRIPFHGMKLGNPIQGIQKTNN